MKQFFNHPYQFSFKDFLALTMISPFLICVFRFMFSHIEGDLDLIKILVPIIITVLGGYFGQEMASAYFTRGTVYNPYNPYSSTMITSTASQEGGEAGDEYNV